MTPTDGAPPWKPLRPATGPPPNGPAEEAPATRRQAAGRPRAQPGARRGTGRRGPGAAPRPRGAAPAPGPRGPSPLPERTRRRTRAATHSFWLSPAWLLGWKSLTMMPSCRMFSTNFSRCSSRWSNFSAMAPHPAPPQPRPRSAASGFRPGPPFLPFPLRAGGGAGVGGVFRTLEHRLGRGLGAGRGGRGGAWARSGASSPKRSR